MTPRNSNITPEQQALVRYRLEMAQAVLADAQLLLRQGGSLWSVINRAYYTMFYATTALLLAIGQGAAKHSGVIALFDKHFVKSGQFPMEMSQWLHKAFELRQRSDYRDMYPLDQEHAKILVEWAEQFVARIKDFLDISLQ
jgi:uncharacterized protein (UPF0332 family)